MDTVLLNKKIAKLPPEKQDMVNDFVEFLAQKGQSRRPRRRIPGKAKGLIIIHPNFNDPIDEFNLFG
jgi:hypothetical protein